MRLLILTAFLALPAAAAWSDHLSEGSRLLDQGKLEEANRELRAALKEAEVAGEKGQGLGAILDALGRTEFIAGRYRNAKTHFERALQIPAAELTGQAAAFSNAGQTCLALGENRQAEKYFRRAIELMPGNARLWRGLGQALFSQNRLTEAEAAYRKALQGEEQADIDERKAYIWSDLSAVLAARNLPEEAIALLRKAMAATPAGRQRARIRRNLAGLEWKAGDRPAAVRHLRESLEEIEAAVGPEHPDVAQMLKDYSEALAETGQKSLSREAAKRAEAIRAAFAGQDGENTVHWLELGK